MAQITFKGKTYYLGSHTKIEDAVQVRQRGEEMYDEFLEWYHWKFLDDCKKAIVIVINKKESVTSQ